MLLANCTNIYWGRHACIIQCTVQLWKLQLHKVVKRLGKDVRLNSQHIVESMRNFFLRRSNQLTAAATGVVSGVYIMAGISQDQNWLKLPFYQLWLISSNVVMTECSIHKLKFTLVLRLIISYHIW